MKRGHDAVTPGDQGTLRSVWMLICGGCLVGFLLAPKLFFFRWPQSLAIVLLADVLLAAGIALRLGRSCILENFYRRCRYSAGTPRGSRWSLPFRPTSVLLGFDACAHWDSLSDLQLAGVPSHHCLFAGCPQPSYSRRGKGAVFRTWERITADTLNGPND